MKYSLSVYFQHAFVSFEISDYFSHEKFQEMIGKYGPPIRVIMTTSDKHGRTVYLSKEDEEFNHKYLSRFGK